MGKPRGVKELEAYQINSDKLTHKRAILAKCAECMGKYIDSKADCSIPDCPLYPYMPYGAMWKVRDRKIIPVERRKHIFGKQKDISPAGGSRRQGPKGSDRIDAFSSENKERSSSS